MMLDKWFGLDFIKFVSYGKDVKFYFDINGKFWIILSRGEKMIWFYFEKIFVVFFEINKFNFSVYFGL